MPAVVSLETSYPQSVQAPRALQPARPARYLRFVVLSTFVVAVCPIALVWSLRVLGVMRSPLPGMLLAMGLSLSASYAGRKLWQKWTGAGDLLWSDLTIWGFVRRWRSERRLASALKLLGSLNDRRQRTGDIVSAELQVKAFEELSAALEARDPYTHGHSRRVARNAWRIAQRMGLSREEVARVRSAAAVHDVGKVHTPLNILNKPGGLTDEEFDAIKLHPTDGARMVEVLQDPELTAIVRHHHERLDGTGYPHGLASDEIPLGARIVAVADTFDAITSQRSYRRARPHALALEVLKREAGTQLDPAAVRAFCSLYSGRHRLLALWASVTSLPEQGFTWLGGSVSGTASAAKVLVAGALVGGMAAGSAAIVHPTITHAQRGRLVSSITSSAPGPYAGASAPSKRRPNPKPGSSRRATHPSVTQRHGSPALLLSGASTGESIAPSAPTPSPATTASGSQSVPAPSGKTSPSVTGSHAEGAPAEEGTGKGSHEGGHSAEGGGATEVSQPAGGGGKSGSSPEGSPSGEGGHQAKEEHQPEEGHRGKEEHQAEEGHQGKEGHQSEESHQGKEGHQPEEGHRPEEGHQSKEGHQPEEVHEAKEGHQPEEGHQPKKGH